jgi:uncharacterized repeat protein (TIGR03806 family)
VSRPAPALALVLAAAGCGEGGGAAPDAGIDRCLVDGEVDLEGRMCDRLSTYGLFTDLGAQTPAPGVVPYQLNTGLFSDYTDKDRFLALPAGGVATWHDEDAFEVPVGTIVIKTFAYPADLRVPDGPRDLLETRLLIRQAGGWTGAAYVYDEAEEEAHLAIAGATLPAAWIHLDGAARQNAYEVPNRNQCKNCHAEHDDVMGLIGPRARHLHRDGQLEGLVDDGLLAGAPADPGSWPRAAAFDDPQSGDVEARARAWLDINCAHCHNPRGAARTSGLDLRSGNTDPFLLGVCKPPVAAGGGSGGLQYSIVPGDPAASILVYRIESTDVSAMMPELGRNLVHAEAVALIAQWISEMPGEGCGG